MLKIKEAIVVEGRYDKIALEPLVDTAIFTTDGFGIFKNKEKLALLRRVAEQRGLIVLTDADGAGLVIRNRLRGAISAQYLKHAYIPDVAGKERRKKAPSRAGTLGVEGMKPEILEEALRRAGAVCDTGDARARHQGPISPLSVFPAGRTAPRGGKLCRKSSRCRRIFRPTPCSTRSTRSIHGMNFYRRRALSSTKAAALPSRRKPPEAVSSSAASR